MKLHSFELWLRKVYFQSPTKEAYDLARDAYKEGINHRNKEILEELIASEKIYSSLSCDEIISGNVVKRESYAGVVKGLRIAQLIIKNEKNEDRFDYKYQVKS